MHRQGATGSCRAHAGDGSSTQKWESDHRKPHLKYNAERAVHLIPLLLLACLLVLYVFSYRPIPGTTILHGDTAEIRFEGKAEPEFGMQQSTLSAPTKGSLQSFSVYSHRSLHQVGQRREAKGKRNRVKNNIGINRICSGSNGHRKLRIPPIQ